MGIITVSQEQLLAKLATVLIDIVEIMKTRDYTVGIITELQEQLLAKEEVTNQEQLNSFSVS